MGSLRWLAENWFTLLNAVGVIGGLFFTGHSLRSETKTRRIANLLSLTDGHRDIWKQVFTRPQLSCILDPNADTSSKPVTREAVRDAIQATKLQTPIGQVAFDANGDLTDKTISIFQVKKNPAKPLDSMEDQWQYIGVAPQA